MEKSLKEFFVRAVLAGFGWSLGFVFLMAVLIGNPSWEQIAKAVLIFMMLMAVYIWHLVADAMSKHPRKDQCDVTGAR